jgi:SAM-dependent methyltransferase
MTQDELDSLRRNTVANRFVPIPPTHRNQSGSIDGGFLEMGFVLLQAAAQEGLTPNCDVLDIGCGVGRVALPLTQYLGPSGSYFGLDINLSAVSWCHEHITQIYPNFEFAVVNARNPHYGNKFEYGRSAMRDAGMPLGHERKFDVVLATSLFTHLLWPDVEFYIEHIALHLTEGGFAYTTWFLIDERSRAAINAGQSGFDFELRPDATTFTLKGKHYSEAIAHDTDALLRLAARHGLVPRRPPQSGGWPFNQPGQDTIVFVRV